MAEDVGGKNSEMPTKSHLIFWLKYAAVLLAVYLYCIYFDRDVLMTSVVRGLIFVANAVHHPFLHNLSYNFNDTLFIDGLVQALVTLLPVAAAGIFPRNFGHLSGAGSGPSFSPWRWASSSRSSSGS